MHHRTTISNTCTIAHPITPCLPSGEHEGVSGRFPHVIAPPKTLQHPAAAASATLPAQPNGNGFGSHPSSSHRCLGLGSASTDDPNADTASADPVPTDSGSARLRAPGMVPSGPGASGFSSSGSASSCSSSSSMAMPQKVCAACGARRAREEAGHNRAFYARSPHC